MMALRGESIRVEAARRSVSVYRVRLERGLRRGLSPGAAVGHAEPGEPTASDLQQVENVGSLAPVGVLQRAAIANAERELGDLPKYVPQAMDHLELWRGKGCPPSPPSSGAGRLAWCPAGQPFSDWRCN